MTLSTTPNPMRVSLNESSVPLTPALPFQIPSPPRRPPSLASPQFESAFAPNDYVVPGPGSRTSTNIPIVGRSDINTGTIGQRAGRDTTLFEGHSVTTYATNKASSARPNALISALVWLKDAWIRHRARRLARAELLHLNDALLRDIGLSRFDVHAAGGIPSSKRNAHPNRTTEPDVVTIPAASPVSAPVSRSVASEPEQTAKAA